MHFLAAPRDFLATKWDGQTLRVPKLLSVQKKIWHYLLFSFSVKECVRLAH